MHLVSYQDGELHMHFHIEVVAEEISYQKEEFVIHIGKFLGRISKYIVRWALRNQDVEE